MFFTKIAENAGYKTLDNFVQTKMELQNALDHLMKLNGASFIDIRIRKGARSTLPPLKASLTDLKNDFMRSLR